VAVLGNERLSRTTYSAPAGRWTRAGGVRSPVASPATLIRTKDTRRPQDSIDQRSPARAGEPSRRAL